MAQLIAAGARRFPRLCRAASYPALLRGRVTCLDKQEKIAYNLI